MNRCPCQSPPAWADGDAGRSSSAAASLPQPEMPGDVLDLYALRSRPVLLRRGLPSGSPTPAMPRCQPPAPAESRRPARSPRPTTRLPRASRNLRRDGSIFPIGHFSGTIRLWRNDPDASRGHAASGACCPAGKAGRSLAALLDLWPARPFRRSFPTHPRRR